MSVRSNSARGAVAVLVLAMTLMFGTGYAGGTHFDSMFKVLGNPPGTPWWCQDNGSSTPPNVSGRYCRTDNSTLTYFTHSSLSSTGQTRVVSRMNNVYDPTDLTVIRHTTAKWSGSAETDIIFRQRSDIPSGFAGLAWCDDAVSSTRCDQHYAVFSSATPTSAVICHEAGHSIGLTHGANADPTYSNTSSLFGCMKNPTGGTTTLTASITSQINATY